MLSFAEMIVLNIAYKKEKSMYYMKRIGEMKIYFYHIYFILCVENTCEISDDFKKLDEIYLVVTSSKK